MISRLRLFSSISSRYDKISNETLESLSEYLDGLNAMDTELSNGVLTVKIPSAGTYVINRQPPNRQLWLSSPRSGPKRYELHSDERVKLTEMWQCERDGGRSLKSLLDEEFSFLLRIKIDCP